MSIPANCLLSAGCFERCPVHFLPHADLRLTLFFLQFPPLVRFVRPACRHVFPMMSGKLRGKGTLLLSDEGEYSGGGKIGQQVPAM